MALGGAAGPEDDRGIDRVRLEHAVLVAPEAGRHVPLYVRTIHQLSREQQLDPLVADLAQVVEPREAFAYRGRDLDRDQPVLRVLVVVGSLEVDPLVEQVGVESCFDFPGLLGLEVRVARPPDGDAGNVRAPGRDGYGPEEVERVERPGRAARHTPGRTQPQA